MKNHRSLIDDWLPIAALGVESQRERGASSALPPLYFLHVWWARRPLTPSRAAVLGTLLPAWSEDWPEHLRFLFPHPKEYQEWFVKLLGIHGDPVADRQRILEATEKGIRLTRAYSGPRSFTVTPDDKQFEVLQQLLAFRWGTNAPVVLDPTAGGGSIPFEAIRFGFPTIANELNPVASFVLEGTLTLPAQFGSKLLDDITHWGNVWVDRVRERLEPFFPRHEGESIFAYLFARTVACPETGKPVPLNPNWWLQRKTRPYSAARIVAEPDLEVCQFEIARGNEIDFDPNIGTVKRGVGRSPWTGTTIPSGYIKAEAQAGRMGSQMYAVAVKTGREFEIRHPDQTALAAVRAAEEELERVEAEWLQNDLIPDEGFPDVASDMRPHHYGMSEWRRFFSPRQLLVMGTAVEELRSLQEEMQEHLDTDSAAAVNTYLAKAVDKMASYNSIIASWHVGRAVIRSVFDRHDFSFKWSFTEFDGAHNLLPWAVSQVADAYEGIAGLLEPSRQVLFPSRPEQASQLIELHNGDAADLPIADGSVHAVVMDPPYYANVQYAELSDFFYVWLKRTAGHLYPHLFSGELTEKATEAVANAGPVQGVR